MTKAILLVLNEKVVKFDLNIKNLHTLRTNQNSLKRNT